MNDTAERETLGFQTEVRQLLHLMIHSLYSNKEIFLRELISNASDAADRLRFESLAAPDLMKDDPELKIRIGFNADTGTISVTDNGIGMSRDELIEHLGTIARSGTAEFLQQMTGDEKKDARLIGQFGVGFYSSFIVADRVEVSTRKAGAEAAEAVLWQSDGQGEFTIESTERDHRGTTITLYLKDTEKEFLDSFRLESLIRKYSDHIAFPVLLKSEAKTASKTDTDADTDADTDVEAEEKTVNSATALWTRPRTEVTDDEYKEFYKSVAHDFADPLTWSHNKVEGKREYTSLLFIPGTAPFDLWNRDAPKGLKLYVQRVFIMDDAEQFLPLYLRFVKGIVDSADLPLNVSRELLQRNPDLDAMRSALTRRVLDMLGKMASDDKENYAVFWKEFGQTIKEGAVEDPQNTEKLMKLLRFATTKTETDKPDHSLDDYVGRMAEGQDKIYYILGESFETASSSPHLEQLRAKGLEVLLLHDRIDPWLATNLTEYEGKSFQDVGRGQIDLPGGEASGDDEQTAEDSADETHKLFLDKIRETLKDQVETVNVSKRLVDSPACVVAGAEDLPPQLRKMLEASGQAIPESKPILEINVEHPLVAKLSAESDETRFGELSRIVLDHALLAEGTQLDNPADYVRRINQYLLDNDSSA